MVKNTEYIWTTVRERESRFILCVHVLIYFHLLDYICRYTQGRWKKGRISGWWKEFVSLFSFLFSAVDATASLSCHKPTSECVNVNNKYYYTLQWFSLIAGSPLNDNAPPPCFSFSLSSLSPFLSVPGIISLLFTYRLPACQWPIICPSICLFVCLSL